MTISFFVQQFKFCHRSMFAHYCILHFFIAFNQWIIIRFKHNLLTIQTPPSLSPSLIIPSYQIALHWRTLLLVNRIPISESDYPENFAVDFLSDHDQIKISTEITNLNLEQSPIVQRHSLKHYQVTMIDRDITIMQRIERLFSQGQRFILWVDYSCISRRA